MVFNHPAMSAGQSVLSRNLCPRAQRFFLLLLVTSFFFVNIGCSRQETGRAVEATTGLGAAQEKIEVVDPQLAKIKCQDLCRVELREGNDLSLGPCLGNPMNGMVDWVCDVAHSPRHGVDSLPENQCSVFRAGTAIHFVEVDEECNIIKIY